MPGVHWTTPYLAPALKEAAAADDPCLVMLLFGDPDCSSYAKAIDKELLQHLHALVWCPSDLAPALVDAVAEGRGDMVGPLFHAGRERWQCEQLAPALLKAVALLNEREQLLDGLEELSEDEEEPFLTMREVDMLLQQPGIEWSATLIAPVVTVGVKAGCSCACLARMVSAARDAWHADQLLPALQQSAAAGGQPQQFRMLLQMPGVKWEAGKLAAVLEQLMAQCTDQLLVEYCSSAQLLKAPVSSYSQIREVLAVKGVQWQPQQLEGLLVRAAEEGPSELLSQVLAMVPWEVEQLLPLVKGAAGVEAEGVMGRARWRTVKVLLGKQGVGWKAEDLMEVLAAAGRAGMRAVVQQLLEMHGVGWRGRTMAVAAAAACGGRQWDVVLLLLRVVGVDWTTRELQGVLDGAAEQGNWQLVMKLLRGALPAAAGGGGGVVWLEHQLRRVLEVAAGQGYDNMVRQLLGFREEVVWQAEDLVAAILAAVKYKRCSTVGVLMRVEGVGWGVQQLKGVWKQQQQVVRGS